MHGPPPPLVRQRCTSGEQRAQEGRLAHPRQGHAGTEDIQAQVRAGETRLSAVREV